MQCATPIFGPLLRGFEPLGLCPRRPNPFILFMSVSRLTVALNEIQMFSFSEDLLLDISSLKKQNWFRKQLLRNAS